MRNSSSRTGDGRGTRPGRPGQEETGKTLLAIAERLPGDDFADLEPKRHEHKLTAMAISEVALLGEHQHFQTRARQIDSGAVHRERLAALYVDLAAGFQSPASVTCERATKALSRTRRLIDWMSTHLGQNTPEAIDVAIHLNATLTHPQMEQYFQSTARR